MDMYEPIFRLGRGRAIEHQCDAEPGRRQILLPLFCVEQLWQYVGESGREFHYLWRAKCQ